MVCRSISRIFAVVAELESGKDVPDGLFVAGVGDGYDESREVSVEVAYGSVPVKVFVPPSEAFKNSDCAPASAAKSCVEFIATTICGLRLAKIQRGTRALHLLLSSTQSKDSDTRLVEV